MAQIVLQLCIVRDDNTFAKRVVLRPSSTSQHLKYVLWQQLYPSTLFGILNLGPLDNDSVCG